MTAAWRSGGLNLASLFGIQAANSLIPLIIVPLVLFRLGAAPYAELAVAEAISMLVLALVLYSFEVDGVARVVGHSLSKDQTLLGSVLGEIVSTRLLLFAIGSAVAIAAAFTVSGRFPQLLALYLLVPLGHVFHSYWFYQGVERNVIPASVTLGARTASLVLVYILVQSPGDQVLVPLLVGGPFALAGVASLAYTRWLLRTRIGWPGGYAVIRSLRHGKEIFGGNAAVSLYREVNVLLLSIVGVASTGVAAYSVAEKAVKMMQACTRPLSQFYFPKMLRAIADFGQPSRDAAARIALFTLYQTVALIVIALCIVGGYVLIAPFSPWLAQFGSNSSLMAMLAVMAPSTVFGLANFMFGSAALNFLGARQYLLGAILLTGCISVVLCLVLAAMIGALGGAIAFLFAESFLFLLIIRRFFVGGHGLQTANVAL